jgi:hypothetical protein
MHQERPKQRKENFRKIFRHIQYGILSLPWGFNCMEISVPADLAERMYFHIPRSHSVKCLHVSAMRETTTSLLLTPVYVCQLLLQPIRYALRNSQSFKNFPFSYTKLNSVTWVRERTIPTERPPLVGEVSANGSLWPYSRISRLEPLLFLSSSSSTVLTRLSGPRSRPATSLKIW